MVNDVFKFPDGKGGYILKIMGSDQKWHECDEAGNYTEKEEPAPEKESAPEGEQSPRKARRLRREKIEGDPNGRLSIRVSEQDGILINDYVAWKSLMLHKAVSRSDIMLKATLAMIKRDSDFNAFMKSQKK